jgi:cytochrome c biogenesis protein
MKNKFTRRIFIFFKSMKFGIILLFFVMLLSLLGTVIPQEMPDSFYVDKYSNIGARFILFLGINNVYSSMLFGTFFAALGVNLIFCSITRFDNVIKKVKGEPELKSLKLLETIDQDKSSMPVLEIKNLFKNYGFGRYNQSKNDKSIYYSIKNKVGYFGSWMLHLGILLVIFFYAFGHITFFSESVYGAAGTVQAIQGTSYKAMIKNFDIHFRQDGSVKRYTSEVELLDENDNSLKASTVSVNSPMRYKGYTFYQTSHGWAANCKAMKKGDLLTEETIYEQSSLDVPGEKIGISFIRLYPDFDASAKKLSTLSEELKNPVILYSLHYKGSVVKMNIAPVGKTIKWNDYEFLLEDPERFTYLSVNRMRGQNGSAFGALLIIIGLLLVFYHRPGAIAVKLEDNKVYIYGNK